LRTPLLTAAAAAGHAIADGLEMLIGQARPSFEALFGRPSPGEVDVRALALVELGGHT
jgi:shikimate dehydrogenase